MTRLVAGIIVAVIAVTLVTVANDRLLQSAGTTDAPVGQLRPVYPELAAMRTSGAEPAPAPSAVTPGAKPAKKHPRAKPSDTPNTRTPTSEANNTDTPPATDDDESLEPDEVEPAEPPESPDSDD